MDTATLRNQLLVLAGVSTLLVPLGDTGICHAAAERPAPAKKFSDALKAIEAARPKQAPRLPKKSPPKKAPPAKSPPGIAPRQTSSDPTYGYRRENPVKVGMRGKPGDHLSMLLAAVRAEKLYLRHLRDAKFRPFKYRRHGCFMGKDGHVIDRYVLTDQDGKRHIIYIDMYHPKAGVLKVKAPKGMYFQHSENKPPGE
jgi:hypothetical protein